MYSSSMINYNPVIFRVIVGLMFLVMGISKVTNIAMITGMLQGLGVPVAPITAWLVAIVEVVGGAMLLLGWKMEYAIWPLIVILIVATVTVIVPQALQSGSPVGIFWIILGIGALVSLHISGPGRFALD